MHSSWALIAPRTIYVKSQGESNNQHEYFKRLFGLGKKKAKTHAPREQTQAEPRIQASPTQAPKTPAPKNRQTRPQWLPGPKRPQTGNKPLQKERLFRLQPGRYPPMPHFWPRKSLQGICPGPPNCSRAWTRRLRPFAPPFRTNPSPWRLAGKDVAGQARPAPCKTAAFLVPIFTPC